MASADDTEMLIRFLNAMQEDEAGAMKEYRETLQPHRCAVAGLQVSPGWRVAPSAAFLEAIRWQVSTAL